MKFDPLTSATYLATKMQETFSPSFSSPPAVALFIFTPFCKYELVPHVFVEILSGFYVIFIGSLGIMR